jgi:phenylpropionate dioxygenase-like ring-hydroxylating dioxygenase large terminal subunit
MMTAEQNDRITRIGPGTACGKLMRLYWQPAALVEELDGPRPVRAVRLLGEDFVLFRDEAGRYGLLDRHCPHRGADLAFGRREDGGLRCAFHGWLFDVQGKCLDTPAEPEGSTLCTRIRQRAYPVVERSGVLWAYLGPGEVPAFPAFDCFVAPDAYTFAFKGLWECNWLQALEIGIDPAHASYLHRFFEDEDRAQGYGKQFRDASLDSDIPMTRLMREFARPSIDVERTAYGLRLRTLRKISEQSTHLRVTNLIFPHAITIPLSQEMMLTQWHVPVDDENCYWYTVFTSFGKPIDKATMRAQRLQVYELPDYLSRKNRHNNYGFDAQEQIRRTYTGMGEDINVHDQWAVEGQGRIQDRTRENLGTSDRAIAAYRLLLRESIEQAEKGVRPLLVVDPAEAAGFEGPITIDGISPGDRTASYAIETDQRRRSGAAWHAAAPRRVDPAA